MSIQVTTAFVQQYKGLLLELAQQQESRLRNTVYVDTNIVGKRLYVDQIGVTSFQQINNRHGDSPLANTPHARRAIDLVDYDVGDLVDKPDLMRVLIDPVNGYVRVFAAAGGRLIDQVIINAFYATAFTGETGGTSVTFPSGQQIAVNSWTYGTGTGNVGLTVSKLIEAKVLLDQNESAMDDPRTLVCTAKQIGNLLATTEVTSSDYAEVKSLVSGQVNTFMGFNFVRTELVPTDGSGYRRVMAYSRTGMALGMEQDAKVNIAERADKRFSTYVYSALTLGASRLEEPKCVEIKCA
jgi:hypothetical protein